MHNLEPASRDKVRGDLSGLVDMLDVIHDRASGMTSVEAKVTPLVWIARNVALSILIDCEMVEQQAAKAEQAAAAE